jgi:hypothetical protein
VNTSGSIVSIKLRYRRGIPEGSNGSLQVCLLEVPLNRAKDVKTTFIAGLFFLGR